VGHTGNDLSVLLWLLMLLFMRVVAAAATVIKGHCTPAGQVLFRDVLNL